MSIRGWDCPYETGPRDRGLAILETEVGVMTSALKRSNVWSRWHFFSFKILRRKLTEWSIFTWGYRNSKKLKKKLENVFIPFKHFVGLLKCESDWWKFG